MSVFFLLSLYKSTKSAPVRVTRSKIFLNEVSYSHTLPYIELVREDEELPDAPAVELLSYFGLLVGEYQRERKRFLLRLAVDLTGSEWRSNDKYFMIGKFDQDALYPGISMNQPNLRKYRLFPRSRTFQYNWLKPPINSLMFVILTKSDNKPLFHPTLIKPLEELQGNLEQESQANENAYLEGDLYDYAVDQSIDMVVIGGGKAPTQCRANIWKNFLANCFGKIPFPQYVAPTDGVLSKSVNRCDPTQLPKESFNLQIFKTGTPTPNAQNNCCDDHVNLEELAENPENVEFPQDVNVRDGCQDDEDNALMDLDHGYAHTNPVLEFKPEKLQEALAKIAQENTGKCYITRRFPTSLADITKELNKHDLDVANFDRLHLEKSAPYDDVWELKPEDEAKIDDWIIMIMEHQEDQIDPSLLWERDVRLWFQYLPNEDDLRLSKFT